MNNLLKYRIVGGAAASRFYPLVAQAFVLACFLLIIAGGLTPPRVSAQMAGTLRNTNLAALVVWSLWWPLVIITAVFFGRVWCQVCPMELVNSLVSRIGPRRAAPRFLTSGWGVTLFYSIALLGFIRTLSANRYPDRMAYFFLFLLVSAVVIGAIFEKRAFCNFLCPVGRLLGLYGCCAALEWRASDAATCDNCASKDCVDARNAYKLTGRGCTSNLYPATIEDNRRCHVCTQCRKVCPHDNLRLSLRRPMADFFTPLRFTSAEFFLLFLASGLVAWEMAEEWRPARSALDLVPGAVSSWFGLSGEAANLVHAIVLFVLLPAVLFLIPGLAGRRANGIPLMESVKAFTVVFLPVIALSHVVKAAIRITSRLPYYPLAFHDPAGYTTATLIDSGAMKPDASIASVLFPWVSWGAVLVLALALASAWWIGLRSPAYGRFSRAGRAPYLAAVTVYAAAIIVVTVAARF